MNIRRAAEKDIAMLVDLFLEMDQHYDPGSASQPEVFRRRIEAWFETNTDTALFVAEEDDALLGHASLAPLFPAAGGQTALFIKDVFVSDKARGRGIGEGLVRACAAEAKKRGAPRLELTVDMTNEGAMRLYKRLGARDTEKTYLRWDGASLSDLAEGNDHG